MKSVYLDQNVFGHMLDSGDWTTHLIGKLLHDNAEDVGVWILPTHVIELSQASDHARRARRARLMLKLSYARRSWWRSRTSARGPIRARHTRSARTLNARMWPASVSVSWRETSNARL
jgi:hypothetical protein